MIDDELRATATETNDLLSETWEAGNGPSEGVLYVAHSDTSLLAVASFQLSLGGDVSARDGDRARLTVLGKRALALILKHEWCESSGEAPYSDVDRNLHSDSGRPSCPERFAVKSDGCHFDHCEWGKIVAEAAKLRGPNAQP